MDVDFFTDDKVQYVSSRFEEKGELIAVKLLCKIYKNGYHITWNEDAALLFAKSAGNNISPGLVNEVVNELLKRDFFDKDLHTRFSILTSNGIQRRFLKICHDSKRKDVQIPSNHKCKQLTHEETELTTEETSLTHKESTQRKVKEIKVKEKKGGDARAGEKSEMVFIPENKIPEPSPGSASPPSYTPPSQAMCEVFFEGCGYGRELGEKFYLTYQSTGWKVNNSPIEDWAAMAKKWALTQKNFNNGTSRDQRREPAPHGTPFGKL